MKKSSILIGVILVAVIAAATAGFLLLQRPDHPNVILISIDSLRPDHLGCYGYARPTSPEIDRIAAEGALFEVATSSSSWTLPSHAAMFTSLPDRVHGCFDDGRWLDGSRRTLAEAFRDAGYATAGFFAGPYLHPTFGFAQGFDAYHDCTSYSQLTIKTLKEGNPGGHLNALSHRDITNPIVEREVTRMLDAHDGRPLFAFIHLWDVHYDYIPPEPYRSMFDPDYRGKVDGSRVLMAAQKPDDWTERDVAHLRALYDGEIRCTDDALKRILAALEQRGLLENAIVVITADHGEAFYEHGRQGHRHSLFEEETRIPLVVHYPRTIRPGQRITHPAQMIDIAPTLLMLAGVDPLPDALGRSLFDVQGKPTFAAPDKPAVLELVGAAAGIHQIALRTASWKLQMNLAEGGAGQPTVYDLIHDPREESPLPPERFPLPERELTLLYVNTIRELQKAAQRLPIPGERDTPAINEMTEAQLRSLGYLK